MFDTVTSFSVSDAPGVTYSNRNAPAPLAAVNVEPLPLMVSGRATTGSPIALTEFGLVKACGTL